MTLVADRAAAARLSRPAAFTAIAAILVTFAAASAVPSPLYVVYQQLWGFSPAVLTVIFAVYVVALIATLLTVGALSDHVGRRPVLAGAILLEAVSLVLFLAAGDVSVLLVARIVQGVATGAALSTLGATLIDLNPAHAPGRAGLITGIAPVAGLGLGAFGAGALVKFAPFPTHLVYAVLLTGMVIAGLAVAWMPETSVRRPGAAASLIPRLGVPARLRGDLFALVPIIVASWALGGLYLSLGPSVASDAFGIHDHLLAGLVVALVTGTGAITSFLLRGTATARVLTVAGAGLLTGGALGVAGLVTGSLGLATAGTVISGAGFGAASLASFSTLARIAEPHERGGLLAVALTISYAALSIPAVIAGQAATRIGLHTTALWYGTVVAALGLVALLTRRRA
ncbi:MFS transporter [Actinoplanes ianthinogenes]|uniref:MFS transporter n=1 Tax=Actinoplanes ianthinogenes TaxID=122358 RepID=A0ABM7LXV4_9ACTN|nr:MFS transporter [Actinoplanes ianthinogenes]BCJ44045.1 MFS transporter [Actinoplanes ianthinogenes]GGR39984.1 MFS transporter [Actinoplanes ianthinogenes]